MEVPDNLFRRVVKVSVDEGEKSQARYKDQPSLRALEDGDHPKAVLPGPFRYPIHRAMPNAAVAAVKCFSPWTVPRIFSPRKQGISGP